MTTSQTTRWEYGGWEYQSAGPWPTTVTPRVPLGFLFDRLIPLQKLQNEHLATQNSARASTHSSRPITLALCHVCTEAIPIERFSKASNYFRRHLHFEDLLDIDANTMVTNFIECSAGCPAVKILRSDFTSGWERDDLLRVFGRHFADTHERDGPRSTIRKRVCNEAARDRPATRRRIDSALESSPSDHDQSAQNILNTDAYIDESSMNSAEPSIGQGRRSTPSSSFAAASTTSNLGNEVSGPYPSDEQWLFDLAANSAYPQLPLMTHSSRGEENVVGYHTHDTVIPADLDELLVEQSARDIPQAGDGSADDMDVSKRTHETNNEHEQELADFHRPRSQRPDYEMTVLVTLFDRLSSLYTRAGLDPPASVADRITAFLDAAFSTWCSGFSRPEITISVIPDARELLPQGYSIAFPAIALLVDQRELRCPRVWPATTDLFGFSKGLAAWLGVVTTVWVTIIITHKQSATSEHMAILHYVLVVLSRVPTHSSGRSSEPATQYGMLLGTLIKSLGRNGSGKEDSAWQTMRNVLFQLIEYPKTANTVARHEVAKTACDVFYGFILMTSEFLLNVPTNNINQMRLQNTLSCKPFIDRLYNQIAASTANGRGRTYRMRDEYLRKVTSAIGFVHTQCRSTMIEDAIPPLYHDLEMTQDQLQEVLAEFA